MNVLANEFITPADQKDPDNPVKFEIKALTSIQLTEVTMSGMTTHNGQMKMNFEGITLLLRYGLVKPSESAKMLSAQHMEVAMAIYQKAIMSEEARKNS